MVSSEHFTQMVKYVGSEEISTSIDRTAHKCPWLFHIVKNLGCTTISIKSMLISLQLVYLVSLWIFSNTSIVEGLTFISLRATKRVHVA